MQHFDQYASKRRTKCEQYDKKYSFSNSITEGKTDPLGGKLCFSATYKSKPHGENNGTEIAVSFMDFNKIDRTNIAK